MRMILPADIIEVTEYPVLYRRPVEIPRSFNDSSSYEKYTMGPEEIHGHLVFTTKRSVFPAGETLEVKHPTGPRYPKNYVVWKGYVERCSFKYNTDVHSPDYGTPYSIVTMRPTGRPIFSSEQPVITGDTNMKVFDGVVLKLDDKGEPASIAKVIAPFLAKDAKSAREEALVDYAIKAKLTGKDLAGYSVRVRCFQETTL